MIESSVLAVTGLCCPSSRLPQSFVSKGSAALWVGHSGSAKLTQRRWLSVTIEAIVACVAAVVLLTGFATANGRRVLSAGGIG